MKHWWNCFPSDPREKSLDSSRCAIFTGVCLVEVVGVSQVLGTLFRSGPVAPPQSI